MEQSYGNTDTGKNILKVIYDASGNCCFNFAISYDHKNYHLWVNSTQYGRAYDISDKVISEKSAKKIFDLVFPVSKWEIERSEITMLDGPYLGLEYRGLCYISLSSSSFNHAAVDEMISTLIKECLKEGTC